MQGANVGERYELLDRLGEGVFGEVWLAHDHHLDRRVALKLFRPGVDASKAFSEARLLSALQGRYILQVLNADVYQDVRYMATEVAGAGSADKHMRPRGISPTTAVRWTSDLLLGLDLCHSRGLVHRDVKPENLFLSDLGHAQLGDFGVAEFLRDGRAPADGDPRVRAPEMYLQNEATVRSDIYSAGLTLYALLAGDYPIQLGGDIAEAVTSGAYPDIRDAAPHVSRGLAARVRKAMHLDPLQRYSSARQMHEALAGPSPVHIWRRVEAHAGHEACWAAANRAGTTRLTLCVMREDGNLLRVEVRRSAGQRTRVRGACRERVAHRALASTLRAVFSSLG